MQLSMKKHGREGKNIFQYFENPFKEHGRDQYIQSVIHENDRINEKQKLGDLIYKQVMEYFQSQKYDVTMVGKIVGIILDVIVNNSDDDVNAEEVRGYFLLSSKSVERDKYIEKI
jgi:hypothetical protein